MGAIIANPIRGNDGAYFTLKLKASVDPADELDGHVKKVEMSSEDKDDVTMAEVQQGLTKLHKLKVTAIPDLTEGSLWRLLHDNPSGTFECVYGPYGNAVASPTKPHIVGDLKASGKPTLGQEARTTRQREEFEYEMEYDGEYELDEGI